ncbi:hypothetical protein V5O48_002598 [Marasmius crinis-equi]|uniref:Uncharacterized protein n=1 Tax=Marasmius crinis-equi TaxID=585013 RepID=A0ABR3FVM5_9AGAR
MFTLDDASDPFYQLMQPPPNETPEETTARLKREADAQRVSDAIDEEIKHHKALAKKNSNVVKVLLLGQAESDFRMRYDSVAWDKERNGWRAVVLLNLIRSIITIITLIEEELGGDVNLPFDRGSGDEDEEDNSTTGESSSEHESINFGDRHHRLMVRLAPLRSAEAALQRALGAGTEYLSRSSLPMSATPFDTPTYDPLARKSSGEFAVRCWHDVVHPDGREQVTGQSPDLATAISTVSVCRDDMKALWEDKLVQHAIAKGRVRLPDSAAFFLTQIDRIASSDYSVTDDDIVRARLRTVGIQEYKVTFKSTSSTPDMPRIDGAWEWRIFDVGGCRTVRAAWLPFFENTNAIIFLCPLSCFDERLEEDFRVNRLEDSTLLWRSICSTKLLSKTQLILFMNKCDLLKKKLKQGVLIRGSLTSYGDRPNEVMPFVKYLREKFKEILKANSPEPRGSYIYPTTVTDTQATAKTLESVRDGVLRENLVRSQLM